MYRHEVRFWHLADIDAGGEGQEVVLQFACCWARVILTLQSLV
jgi:hypothetical protein